MAIILIHNEKLILVQMIIQIKFKTFDIILRIFRT